MALLKGHTKGCGTFLSINHQGEGHTVTNNTPEATTYKRLWHFMNINDYVPGSHTPTKCTPEASYCVMQCPKFYP